MAETKKPTFREFWINDKGPEIYQTNRSKKHFECSTRSTWKEETHVVEYAALEEAQREIAELRGLLTRIQDMKLIDRAYLYAGQEMKDELIKDIVTIRNEVREKLTQPTKESEK